MKTCNKCSKVKDLDLFRFSSDCKNGRRAVCIDCCKRYDKKRYEDNKDKLKSLTKKFNKDNPEYSKRWRDDKKEKIREWHEKNPNKRTMYHLKNKYGITIEQYDQMVADQDGRCKVCLEIPLGDKGQSKLNVDHCHLTGEVRGLLCGKCNKALGLLRESEEITQNLVWYIQNHVKEIDNDGKSTD